MGSGSTREARRTDLAGVPIGEVVTVRGRELSVDATVGDARRLFASPSVQVLPLLEPDGTYRASLTREALEHAHDEEAALPLASADLLPTAPAGMAAETALRRMDDTRAQRLVVLDEHGRYAGLVCLRSDRERLCVDAECHHVAQG